VTATTTATTATTAAGVGMPPDHVPGPTALPPDDPDRTPVRARQVRWAADVIRQPGLAPWFEERLPKVGRPRTEITVEGMLVCMLLSAVEGNGLLLNRVAHLAYQRIPRSFRKTFHTDKAYGNAREEDTAYKNVRDRFHAMCAVADPSPHPKNRRLTKEWQAQLDRPLTDEQRDERQQALNWIMDVLVDASVRMLDPAVLARWQGSIGVDGTKVPAFALGRSRGGVWESTDPDAAWHVRKSGTHGLAPGEKPDQEASWAYEAHLAVMGYDRPVPAGGARPFPKLTVRARVDKPAFEPGVHAARLARSLHEGGYPAGWLVADRGITDNSSHDQFHTPVYELGYKVVADYKKNHLGRQGRGHEGAHLVDGWWYCPAMPDQIANATADYENGRIDERTWRQRLDERDKFAFRHKQAPETGKSEVLYCPAAGPSPTAACPIKPKSQRNPRPHQTVAVPDPVLRRSPPKACTQTSISVPWDVHPRWRQHVPHKTAEWHAIWGMVRGPNEGSNADLKNPLAANLGNSRVRRVRGIAAQSLLIAFMVVGTNVRLIRSWERLAEMTEPLDDGHGAPVKKNRGTRHLRDREMWETVHHLRNEPRELRKRRPPGPDTDPATHDDGDLA